MNPKLYDIDSLPDYLKSYPREIQNWVLNDYVSKQNPIIIGGCGRSGTSLLRARLNQHANLASGPETFLCIPFIPSKENTIFDPEKRDEVPNWVDTLRILYDFSELEAHEIWIKAKGQAEFTDLFFELACKNQKKKRWVEKTPKNVQAVGWIFSHWPKAKFIHVIRDGRDVVCSLRTHPKWIVKEGIRVPTGTSHSIESCIKRWNDDVIAGLGWRGHPNYHEIRYEELIQSPVTTLLKLLRFINEPWDSNLLKPNLQFDFIKDPQADGVEQDFYKSKIGRWKEELTLQEKEIVRHEATDLLILLGYIQGASWR